jgi:hypothetical protein
MAIASGSRNCTPTNAALAAGNVEQAVTAGPATYGGIALTRDLNGSGQGYSDNAKFAFLKVLTYPAGSQPFMESYLDDPPLGTCMVYNSTNPSSDYGLQVGSVPADAGSSFTVTGPNGSKVLTGTPGSLNATLSPTGTYLSPGAYTITGTGGADIGGFSAPLNIPAAPPLTNPANFALPPVTRSSGLTVAWTGGAPNAIVQIQVQAVTDTTNTNGATALCNVASSAGTFTIPPYALLAIPAANVGNGFQFQQWTEAAFTAQGLNLGSIQIGNAATFIGGFTLK